ncbi:MAG: hypothetical protein ACK587_07610 [Cyanobacteriota bacterium]|jgi:hypothetical protein
MKNSASSRFTLNVYTVTTIIALSSCIYVFLKPGISSPIFPELKMGKALKNISAESLISTDKMKLDKDSSDRKVSSLYTYNYKDGSKILAAIVRVRKRDDFKIETYGLLTKNIDPIYLKNSNAIHSNPPSLSGKIGNDNFIQTCVIPKTTTLEENDFRLDNLTTIVEKVNPRSNSFLDKIMGTRNQIDYSCLVLTYKSSNKSVDMPPKNWPIIVKAVQQVLSH